MSIEHAKGPEQSGEHSNGRRQYILGLARRHWDAMRLLLKGGRLSKKDKWRNVAEHCTVAGMAAEVLTEQLQFTDQERQAFCDTALVHDWRKRIDVGERRLKKMGADDPGRGKLEQELQEMRKHAEALIGAVSPREDILEATGDEFTFVPLENTSLAQRLMFYIDNISGVRAADSGAVVADIVSPQARIAELRQRRPELELSKRLGRDYWDNELERLKAVEQELWHMLTQLGHQIASPEDLPEFIRGELMRRMGMQGKSL